MAPTKQLALLRTCMREVTHVTQNSVQCVDMPRFAVIAGKLTQFGKAVLICPASAPITAGYTQTSTIDKAKGFVRLMLWCPTQLSCHSLRAAAHTCKCVAAAAASSAKASQACTT